MICMVPFFPARWGLQRHHQATSRTEQLKDSIWSPSEGYAGSSHPKLPRSQAPKVPRSQDKTAHQLRTVKSQYQHISTSVMSWCSKCMQMCVLSTEISLSTILLTQICNVQLWNPSHWQMEQPEITTIFALDTNLWCWMCWWSCKQTCFSDA